MKTATEKTLDVLEWPRFLTTLREAAMSPLGHLLIENLVPEKFTKSEAPRLSRSIIELVSFLQHQKVLPLTDLSDLTNVYKRMSRGGIIYVEEFSQISAGSSADI